MLKRDAEALRAAEAALARRPRDALTFDTIGVVLSRLGAHARAVPAFRQAVRAAPDNASYRFNLAASLRFVGDFEEAERLYESVVELAPRFYRAHSALAGLRRQTPQRNHVGRLLTLLAGVGEDIDGELHLRHALAKEYEDLGNYASAFDHLQAGNTRKRQSIGYSFEGDRALFERIEEVCRGNFLAGSGGASSDAPIFVIGMPRTGTTLVERILASHPDVTSAGELQAFGRCVRRAAGTRSSRVLDPETVAAAAGADFAAIGEAYLRATRGAAGATKHFVDKMPLNFFYVGFIHRALPNAKIVCLRRDPLDTCLSNFRQLFALDFSYYNYAHDLSDIGRYYASFDRLIEHWERELPGKLVQVRYEELVADQAGETRRLLELCGLAWDDACLSFHTNAAPVATASAVQVREPLYASAVGRWRRYADKLGALQAQLLAAGIDGAQWSTRPPNDGLP